MKVYPSSYWLNSKKEFDCSLVDFRDNPLYVDLFYYVTVTPTDEEFLTTNEGLPTVIPLNWETCGII